MIGQIDFNYIRIRPYKIWSRFISYFLFEGRPITTRGRFINYLVFFGFKLLKKIPFKNHVKKPIFIIGTGRSGTTILGIILSIHKSVSYLNEPKALWHEIYEFEDVIGNYSEGKASYRLNKYSVDNNIIKKARNLYSAYLKISGGERVVDKYPELIFRVPFVHSIFKDSLFIFIARNGYSTLESISNWSKKFQRNRVNSHEDWWGLNDRKWNLICEQLIKKSKLLQNKYSNIIEFNNHKDRATVEWILTMEEGIDIMRKNPKNVLFIKYEDLIENQYSTLKKVLNFSNLDYDQKMFNYASEVLKSSPKMKCQINPILKEPFYKVMHDLNYD